MGEITLPVAENRTYFLNTRQLRDFLHFKYRINQRTRKKQNKIRCTSSDCLHNCFHAVALIRIAIFSVVIIQPSIISCKILFYPLDIIILLVFSPSDTI